MMCSLINFSSISYRVTSMRTTRIHWWFAKMMHGILDFLQWMNEWQLSNLIPPRDLDPVFVYYAHHQPQHPPSSILLTVDSKAVPLWKPKHSKTKTAKIFPQWEKTMLQFNLLAFRQKFNLGGHKGGQLVEQAKLSDVALLKVAGKRIRSRRSKL